MRVPLGVHRRSGRRYPFLVPGDAGGDQLVPVAQLVKPRQDPGNNCVLYRLQKTLPEPGKPRKIEGRGDRSMSSNQFLEAVSARLSAVSGDRWEVVKAEQGAGIEVMWASGQRIAMRATRELAPASQADIQFIGHARSDVERLLQAIQGKAVLSPEEITWIEARCRAASPAPWRAFIEAEGGLGGCDMIQVSDQEDEPDLYLWLGPNLAPSADFRFVASARQDIPHLIAVLTDQR